MLSKRNSLFLVITILSIKCSESDIRPCSASPTSEACYVGQGYSTSDYATGTIPVQVNTTILVKDVVDINENERTVTLFADFVFEWIDSRISVVQTPSDQEL